MGARGHDRARDTRQDGGHDADRTRHLREPDQHERDGGPAEPDPAVTIAPGGHTGWHTHPGGTGILVQAATFTLYNEACARTVTQANGGTFETGGHVQLARNEGSLPLILTVVYFDVPVGGAVRTDAAIPACAVGADANNLPEPAAGSGVTFAVAGGIIQRATFASAATITSGAGRDVFVQHQTYAAGGHSGWHSNPGATMVYIESGTLSFYTTHCAKHTFSAGQGVVEPGGQVMLAKNETAAPAVLRVVYFDVPAGGSARIDNPEPATFTGLVAGAAAQPTAAPTAARTAAPRQLPSTSAEATAAVGPGLLAIIGGLASASGLAVVVVSRWRRLTG